MSGIFKSVKKVLKKVGKIVKKIAPYLILAAGVYFGGSYLMSVAGGATAGAAGSAATAFTKSAGVWKSFMGGLAEGNAASSAATYAEASYGVMKAGGSLAQQTAAATKAVNLYPTMGVQNAVKSVTTNDAWKAFVPNQADPSAFQAYMNAETSGGPVAASTTPAGSSIGQYGINEQTGALVQPTGEYGLNFQQRQHANEFAGMITQPAAAPPAAGQLSGAQAAGVAPQTTTPTSPQVVAGGQAGGSAAAGAKIEGEMSVSERLWQDSLDYRKEAGLQSQRNFDQQMAMTQQAHTRGMYGLLLQGGGALLQAWGASETAKDEKEWREKGLKWKAPKDPIDVVNPNIATNKVEVA